MSKLLFNAKYFSDKITKTFNFYPINIFFIAILHLIKKLVNKNTTFEKFNAILNNISSYLPISYFSQLNLYSS